MTDMTETIARAMYDSNAWWRLMEEDDGGAGTYREMADGARLRRVEWIDLHDGEKADLREEARVARAAHIAALTAAGYVIVPREATAAMCEAGGDYPERPSAGYVSGVWTAMLAAAPEAS